MPKIVFTENDIEIVAQAMGKSRGHGKLDFSKPYAPGSLHDKIYTEATRVVAALRTRHE